MKIPLKSREEIALLYAGGQKLSQILVDLVKTTQVGVRLKEIETKAGQQIEKAGGKPAFAEVPGYRWATCLNINEGIVHGVPNDYQIQSGDIVSIDLGMRYRGWITDTSTTFQVPADKPQAVLLKTGEKVNAAEIKAFLATGKKALIRAINQARPGKRIGHISAAIQRVIEGAGYTTLKNLTGHGVGRALHEPPSIPCFLREEVTATPMIKPGMVLAVEVIYTMGSHETETDKDGWTIRSRDGKIAAVFEKTIAVNSDGPLVCT